MSQISTAATASDLSIVILDRGFVVVGHARVDGDWIEIADASVVRRWGTTRGLGEIAMGGPTSRTELDPCGELRSPLRAVIGVIPCEAGKWPR